MYVACVCADLRKVSRAYRSAAAPSPVWGPTVSTDTTAPGARSCELVRGRLELRQSASDLGHLLLHLDRRVIAHADGEQPQRPVAQLRDLDRGGELKRSLCAQTDSIRSGARSHLIRRGP